MDFQIDNETKVIALLSGYARELGEGKPFDKTTFDLASTIDGMYSKRIKELEEACVHALEMCENRVMPTENNLTMMAGRLKYAIK